MGLTSKQWFQIISGINGGLITGAALLQTLFGQDLTLKIVACLGIIGIIINSVGTALSGISASIKDVAMLPGVDKVVVNAGAGIALAQASVSSDPDLAKVEPTSSAQSAVVATAAKG